MLNALDARTSAALPEAVRREVQEIESIGGVSHLKDILAEVRLLYLYIRGKIPPVEVHQGGSPWVKYPLKVCPEIPLREGSLGGGSP